MRHAQHEFVYNFPSENNISTLFKKSTVKCTSEVLARVLFLEIQGDTMRTSFYLKTQTVVNWATNTRGSESHLLVDFSPFISVKICCGGFKRTVCCGI